MKIRTGFVSNSSSTSFTCDVCTTTISDWDMCLIDAEMVECVKGHFVCDRHIKDVVLEELKSSQYGDDWRYDLSSEYCPMCNFAMIADDTIVRYLLHIYDLSRKSVENDIREKFGNLDKFNENVEEFKWL